MGWCGWRPSPAAWRQGWTRVIAEVFHVDIPVKGPVLDELSEIAARVR